MKKYHIEGSRDNQTWLLFAKASTLEEAREIASKCILVTYYTGVRIVESHRAQAVFA